MHRTLRLITLLSPLLSPPVSVAQTLSSRPAIFADPLLATDLAYGDLVLGQTTLQAALRMFAVELQDSVWIPRGHPSNPDTLWSGADIGGPSSAPRAYHRLDLGPGRYTLYFDKQERLVAAKANWTRLPRVLRREDLVARYPTIQTRNSGGTAESRQSVEEVEAPLAPCVSAIASIWHGDNLIRSHRGLAQGTVLDFGYRYTCATRPPRQRAILNREP